MHCSGSASVRSTLVEREGKGETQREMICFQFRSKFGLPGRGQETKNEGKSCAIGDGRCVVDRGNGVRLSCPVHFDRRSFPKRTYPQNTSGAGSACRGHERSHLGRRR